jgi:Holliday junction resolvase
MSNLSRDKGAAFEREVAKELYRETGINFRRNLTQTQEAGLGDLIADNPAFCFSIECKRAAKGIEPRTQWIAQTFAAAKKANQHPCLIWRFDRQPIKVRVWFDAIAEAVGGHAVCGQSADVTIQGLAWLAREIMARRAEK